MMQEYTTDGTNDSNEELHVVSGQLLTFNDPIEIMDTVVLKNNDNITSSLQLIQDEFDDDVNFFDTEERKQTDNVDNYDDNKDDDELIVIKGRSLEMNDQLPHWVSVVDQDSKSNLITSAINNHITDNNIIDRLNKFSIRLHNALYSIDNSINLSAKAIVTAKISLLPVPAKTFILRSSIPTPASISSPSSSPNSLTSTTTITAINQQYYDFSFGKKIVSLSMSAGDVRSKSFKDGACPRLNIDLNLSNGETIFNSNLQLYLPQLLLSYQSGQLLSLPLVNTSSNSILATIIIELICPQKNSIISNNNIINIINKDKSNHTNNSINKNIFIFNSKIIALTGKSLVNIKSEVLDEAKNKYFVDIKLTASGGISKRIDLKLNPTFRSEDLEFNHDEDNVKNTNNNNDHHHHHDSLLDMKSINPDLDILNLSFRKGPYDEDELGFIQIPIIFLQNLDLAGKASDVLIALIAWKMIINVDQRCMFTSSKFSFIWKLLSIHPILDTENLQLNDRNEEVDHDDDDDDSNGGGSGIVDKNVINSAIDVKDSDYRLLPSSQGSVKSITGQLLCCIEGLFINRGSNKDSTLNSDKGFSFSKGSTIGLEIILWPEGTKTTSLLCIPIILPKENDIEAIVELKKTFNMLITVALQQVTSVVSTSHSIIYLSIYYINYHSFMYIINFTDS